MDPVQALEISFCSDFVKPHVWFGLIHRWWQIIINLYFNRIQETKAEHARNAHIEIAEFLAVGKAPKAVFWPSCSRERTIDRSGFLRRGTLICESTVRQLGMDFPYMLTCFHSLGRSHRYPKGFEHILCWDYVDWREREREREKERERARAIVCFVCVCVCVCEGNWNSETFIKICTSSTKTGAGLQYQHASRHSSYGLIANSEKLHVKLSLHKCTSAKHYSHSTS